MKNIKIVISPDSLKGSISASDAALAIERGLRAGFSRLEQYALTTVISPIADGGEGTLDALVSLDKQCPVKVTGTAGETVTARIGYVNDTAVIEMAMAAGLTLVPPEKRSAADSTTYGVGEMIKFALDGGAKKLLITVGGSGTNDGGCGMAAALGVKFYDSCGREFIPTGGSLIKLARIDKSGLDPRLAEVQIKVATDVTNPLLGERGATAVYAPQKGASPAELELMEDGMRRYVELLRDISGREVASVAGCGAGGGISAPLLALTDAVLCSGIDAVLDAVCYKRLISDACFIITGEGKLDFQSLYGKAVSGVARYGREAGIPVCCIVGLSEADEEDMKPLGISAVYELAEFAPSHEYSMTHADELLAAAAERFVSDNF